MSKMATSTTGTETFSVKAMVRGYHVYQDISTWIAASGNRHLARESP